jgi:hypothetical protein
MVLKTRDRALLADTIATQIPIVAKYGAKAIDEAKARLCANCELAGTCRLLPMCLNGSDCPYFKANEG